MIESCSLDWFGFFIPYYIIKNKDDVYEEVDIEHYLACKVYSYEPMQIKVDKVIPLYAKSFEQMRDNPLDDCPEIIHNKELIYIEGDTARCILFLEGNGSDGIPNDFAIVERTAKM